jgi:hypothetical protein
MRNSLFYITDVIYLVKFYFVVKYQPINGFGFEIIFNIYWSKRLLIDD